MNRDTQRKIVFVSTMNMASWGGSEVLWSDAASRLLKSGQAVSASVCRWRERAPQLSRLIQEGMHLNERWFPTVQIRPRLFRGILTPVIRRASRAAFTRWISGQRPDVICISHGSVAEDLSLIKECSRSGYPYVVLVHANADWMWPNDLRGQEFVDLYGNARRVYFVSEGNRVLLETQLGIEFTNAEVVRNPFNVRRDAAPPWPAAPDPVRLACVGRLEPMAKGQDLLLRVLAREPWRSRSLTVSFFGKGESEEGLRRLASRLKLDGRVQFCGHINDIESVWATHHALVLPSRFEGLPITTVEAMHCGRPVIVTDVAGNSEIVQDGVTGFIAEAATERHLDAALERAWEQRHNWETMGKAAAKAIRELVPADPAADFAQKLMAAASEGHSTR